MGIVSTFIRGCALAAAALALCAPKAAADTERKVVYVSNAGGRDNDLSNYDGTSWQKPFASIHQALWSIAEHTNNNTNSDGTYKTGANPTFPQFDIKPATAAREVLICVAEGTYDLYGVYNINDDVKVEIRGGFPSPGKATYPEDTCGMAYKTYKVYINDKCTDQGAVNTNFKLWGDNASLTLRGLHFNNIEGGGSPAGDNAGSGLVSLPNHGRNTHTTADTHGYSNNTLTLQDIYISQYKTNAAGVIFLVGGVNRTVNIKNIEVANVDQGGTDGNSLLRVYSSDLPRGLRVNVDWCTFHNIKSQGTDGMGSIFCLSNDDPNGYTANADEQRGPTYRQSWLKADHVQVYERTLNTVGVSGRISPAVFFCDGMDLVEVSNSTFRNIKGGMAGVGLISGWSKFEAHHNTYYNIESVQAAGGWRFSNEINTKGNTVSADTWRGAQSADGSGYGATRPDFWKEIYIHHDNYYHCHTSGTETGGAISVSNSINDVSTTGVGIDGGYGTWYRRTKVRISDCNFQQCNSGNGAMGGAVFTNCLGSVVIENSQFCSNKAGTGGKVGSNGGAVCLYANSIDKAYQPDGFAKRDTIRNCTFTSNSAEMGGGAVYVMGAYDWHSAAIENCSFYQNTTLEGVAETNLGGGAICVHKTDNVAITNCLFDSNGGNNFGGAVKVHAEAGDATRATFKDCTFTGNTALRAGGAVMATNNAAVAAFAGNNVFTNNHQTGDGNMGGGAIATTKDAAIAFPDEAAATLFTGNSSVLNGGAIYLKGGQNDDQESDSVSTNTITYAEFRSNTATKGGGAIFAFATNMATIKTKNCIFTGNTTPATGGAVYMMRRAHLSSENCVYDGNTADGDGGAYYMDGNNLSSFSGDKFKGNVSTGGVGGAISIGTISGDAPYSIADCKFEGNRAKHGGAFATAPYGSAGATTSKVSGSEFLNNKATQEHIATTVGAQASGFGGGAVFVRNTGGSYTEMIEMTACKFQGNGVSAADGTVNHTDRPGDDIWVSSTAGGVGTYANARSRIEKFNNNLVQNEFNGTNYPVKTSGVNTQANNWGIGVVEKNGNARITETLAAIQYDQIDDATGTTTALSTNCADVAEPAEKDYTAPAAVVGVTEDETASGDFAKYAAALNVCPEDAHHAIIMSETGQKPFTFRYKVFRNDIPLKEDGTPAATVDEAHIFEATTEGDDNYVLLPYADPTTLFSKAGQVYDVYRYVVVNVRDNMERPLEYECGRSATTLKPEWYPAATSAMVDFNDCPNYWVGGVAGDGTNFNNPDNWSGAKVLKEGRDLVFATPANNPAKDGDIHTGTAVSDCVLPLTKADGTTPFELTVPNLVNEAPALASGKNPAIVLPAATSLEVTEGVKGYSDPAVKDRIVVSAADPTDAEQAGKPNASFLLNIQNACATPFYGTVEFYSIGHKNASPTLTPDTDETSPTHGRNLTNDYHWQFFGIPVEQAVKTEALSGALVRRYSEKQNNGDGRGLRYYNKFTTLNANTTGANAELAATTMKAWEAFEMAENATEVAGRKRSFAGKFLTCPSEVELKMTRIADEVPTSTASTADGRRYGLGQNIFANSFTRAIAISELDLPATVDPNVYVYTTGTWSQWQGNKAAQTSAAGGYISASPTNAGKDGHIDRIPSMQGFMLKFTEGETHYNTTEASVKLKYGGKALLKNDSPLRAKALTPKAQTVADCGMVKATLISDGSQSEAWLYQGEGFTDGYDYGWDCQRLNTPENGVWTLSANGTPLSDNVSDNVLGKAFTVATELGRTYSMVFSTRDLPEYANLKMVDLVAGKVVEFEGGKAEYTFTADAAGVQKGRFLVVDNPSADFAEIVGAVTGVEAPELTLTKGVAAVYNTAGVKVGEFALPIDEAEMAAALPSGVYMVKTTDGRNVKAAKVVIE